MRLRVRIGLSAVNYTFIRLIPGTDAQLRPQIIYEAEGKRIAISKQEYNAIRAAPHRHYFSTELKCYLRCMRQGKPAA